MLKIKINLIIIHNPYNSTRQYYFNYQNNIRNHTILTQNHQKRQKVQNLKFDLSLLLLLLFLY
jgi:hypothetical protein